MEKPVILTAFGTTTKSIATYMHLDKALRPILANHEIIWARSSNIIRGRDQQHSEITVHSLQEILTNLANRGTKDAIIQSLHLFPGSEFHKLCRHVTSSDLNCHVGMPIFTAQSDYAYFCQLLSDIIKHHQDKQILVLGHGTTHPTWAAYYALEASLRQHFGDSIHVGVMENQPDFNTVSANICKSDNNSLLIVPLFLVTGMHYSRDIISSEKSSWKSRLEGLGFSVDVLDYGIGLYRGIETLIAKHIQDAKPLN